MNEEKKFSTGTSYWMDSVTLPDFPSLEETIDTDVGIVGAGITGLTTAYLLAKNNIKTVLIDANGILEGTTGHTTAKITAQHGLIYDELINHFGKESASLYYKAATDAISIIENTVRDLQIECDFSKEDAYIYTDDEEYISQLENEAKAYEKLDIPGGIVDDLPLEIPYKKALVMKNQAQFHPLKYLLALAEACKQAGVTIYTDTPAIDVEHYKHPAIITRAGHRIKCKNVVVASHFPFHDGQGLYPIRMYAERAYVLAVKTKEQFPGGMYINAEDPTRSIRALSSKEENIWLIVGENHKTGQGEQMTTHYEALKEFAQKQFGIAEVLYHWSTQDLTTLDKLPYIGPITKTEDAVYVGTGYRKWGMTSGTIAGKIISDAIIGKENAYAHIFSPSRFKADPSARKLIRGNTDVAKHLLKGKLDFTKERFDDLSVDEAVITRIDGKRAGVYKDAENQLHIVDTTCTHWGCEVAWNDAERTWDCPCHGSRFSYTGDVIEGPAKRPLKHIDGE
ncbi:FAD-dependent oxidoreductase [Virgibacillus halophilus]|uniref:FAD-dependent oxidoreductase n=1 Tax=Tigheibacillus halophilus TaxID=361280 RepID=UPI00362585B6